ncbi:hypothetical protein HHI36_024218 [Cryptolaemus montrouzieri]|uniref:BEN domain-containing protein n=1 Tax=Cryptolaemus montrouzieri TaxID=559131 RepID=A0ABD2NIL5_9CUCU
MDIDKVLSVHNYTKKDSFDTIYHVDKPPEKAVNIYEESKMMFQDNSVPTFSMTTSEGDEVLLGTGGTTVPRSEYEKLDFERMKYTIAVRRLLNMKFTREELATHSQTGKASPPFIGVKARKPQLDPVRVGDIRLHVTQKYNIDTSFVNKAITVALADARKTKKRKIKKDDSD